MSDPFRYDDAAYVMGALDDADRVAFEAHLETCPECRARVAEARSTTALLAGVELAEFEAAVEPIPDTVLPGMLRSARRERVRTRWLTSSLGAVAAACITALIVVLWPSGGSSGPPSEPFLAVAKSPVTASGQLIAKKWGTEIRLECHYAENVSQYTPYRLVVIDDLGRSHQAGSWTLAPDEETEFIGGTSVPLRDIDRVEITLENNQPILELPA
jgi:predicted anti-sigma-YlaC factor YlaD